MKCFIVILVSLNFSMSLAQTPVKKLGEIPRLSELEKEIETFLPKQIADWKSTSRLQPSANQTYVSKNKTFTIKSGKEVPNSGDLARFSFDLMRKGKTAKLASRPISWVRVTHDEKYIIFEPLTVVDTETWKEVDLSKAWDGGGYFELLKYSPSAKKIIVAEFACAMDCPKTDKFEILEFSLK